MDPPTKQAVIADLDRFRKRKEYYRRIGKAWKRGYLLYGPPGTGKSSLVAAVANHLRFNLYDLDLSEVSYNGALQKLLIAMPNKSILVIEDIDCCFSATSREDAKGRKTPARTQVAKKPVRIQDADPDTDSDDASNRVRCIGPKNRWS
jgi:chaperone BCS1